MQPRHHPDSSHIRNSHEIRLTAGDLPGTGLNNKKCKMQIANSIYDAFVFSATYKFLCEISFE